MSTLQTPRTVPQGQVRFAIGLEGVGVRNVEVNPQTMTPETTTAFAPQTEIGLRYGVTDRLDVGAKLYLIGAEVGLKYQVARGDIDAAVAPALAYIGLSDTASDGTNADVRVVYVHLPLLMGLGLDDAVGLGFGPKLMYAGIMGSVGNDFAAVGGFLGGAYASVLFRVGPGFWIAPEVNVYKPLSSQFGDATFWQGGLGFYFGGAENRGQPPATDGVTR